jgi:hypothetical protein
VILGGAVAAGLALDAADTTTSGDVAPAVEAGVAMPAANPAGTLSSTWYCAGGTATDDGIADHVILIENPTDEDRSGVLTVLTGAIAPPPVTPDTTGSSTTSTTEPPTTTTTAPAPEPPAPVELEVPANSRIEVSLRDLVEAPLAAAVVEVEGGEIAVEHEVTTLEEGGGRATAPCSSTAARSWSFPWGVTSRGARELLVFMNPFPDDATVTIDFATDEGTRQTLRFQNFVIPGRSVVGAYVDEDVTRKAQVSAQVTAGSGRVVVDRIQTFDGTDPTLEGITLALGSPVPAEVWMFPFGAVGEGVTEQAVVFNPTDEVAEVEVEVRLDDPEANGVPEPFEATVAPHRYAIVDLHEPDLAGNEDTPPRIPPDVVHSIVVRSLNDVPVTAEVVITRSAPQPNVGVAVTTGAPFAAPRWLFPGGGVTDERAEYLVVANASTDDIVRFDVEGLADGRRVALEGLQDLEIPPAGHRLIRINDHSDLEVLPVVITADGPVVAQRGLFRRNGRGMALSMGIPVDQDVLVFDPLDS